MASSDLRIVTFNVWGLRWVSRHRTERIQAIGDILAGHSTSRSPTTSLDSQQSTSEATSLKPGCPWDIVCLQECWVYTDADYLKRRAKEGGLPYARHYFSGAIGSGLVILSRYPILMSRMLPYPLNGHPLHVIEGDFFAGKGVGSATVDLGTERGHAEILVTHLFAPGGESPAHRLAQVWELGNLARSAADKGRHVFLCGDLNSMPESLTMQFLQGHGQLHDAWSSVHPSTSSTHSTPPSPTDAISLYGVTCDSPLCSFTAGKHLSDIAARQRGKRLDYILYRPSDRIGQDLACTACSVTLTDLVPGQPFSLSDHFAVEARFVFQAAADRVKPPPPARLSLNTYGQVLNELSMGLQRSKLESRFQLKVFVGCVALVPILPLTASFQPLGYLNWIFVLLGIFTGWLGGTMLYVGFVAGRSEEGALRNVIEEMEALKAGMEPA